MTREAYTVEPGGPRRTPYADGARIPTLHGWVLTNYWQTCLLRKRHPNYAWSPARHRRHRRRAR